MKLSELFFDMNYPACGVGPRMGDILSSSVNTTDLSPKQIQQGESSEQKQTGLLLNTINKLSKEQEINGQSKQVSFESMPLSLQKEMIRYCRQTVLSYGFPARRVLGVVTKEAFLNERQEKINKDLIEADLNIRKTFGPYSYGNFNACILNSRRLDPMRKELLTNLLRDGFSVRGKNTIESEFGLVATLDQRKLNDHTTELLLCFPGLNPLGVTEDQAWNREYTILSNLSGGAQMYAQAQHLASLIGEYKENLQKETGRQVHLTVSGHSLGGGFAMVAANVEAVDQALAIQAYPALAEKLDLSAADKVIQVNVHRRTGLDQFHPTEGFKESLFQLIPTDGLVPVALQNIHEDTFKVEALAHADLNPKVYNPHGAVLSHLLLIHRDNVRAVKAD